MDFSGFTDEQLEQIASGKPDFSKFTDAQLEQIAGMSTSDVDGPEVIEEMHPAFSTADRLVAKNLTNDTRGAVGYLQKQHPELVVQADPDTGKIMARRQDEQDWRVLDPDTGLFSTDILRDTLDLGMDAVSAVGTTAATAAGGIAGGAAAGPAGALAGAAGAGALASGGIETLRQSLGKMAGVDQDMDWGSVGLAAGTGLVSPLLFGTGATTGQIARGAAGAAGKKGIAARVAGAAELGALNPFAKEAATAVTPEMAEAFKAMARSQRGGIGIGWDAYRAKVAPKIGAAISGKERASIEALRDNPGLIDEIKAKGGELAYAEDLTAATTKKVVERRQALGAGAANVREEVRTLTDRLWKDVAKNGPKPLEPELLAQLNPEVLAARNIATNSDLAEHLLVDVRPIREQFDVLLNKAMDLYDVSPTAENREAIDELFSVIGKKISDEDYLPIDVAFNLRRSLDQLGKRHKVAQGTASAIADGTPQASIDLQLTAKVAAEKLNEQMDEVLQLFAEGKGFQQFTNKAYSQTKIDSKYLKAYTADPEKAIARLRALVSDAKDPSRQRIARIDKAYGTNLLEEANKLRAFNDFKNASLNPISSGGTTSTSRTIPLAVAGAGVGYWLGANAGLGQGGAGLGAAGGGLLGGFLGGPAALKAYMALQRAGTKAATRAKDSGIRPNQVIPTWLLMEQNVREDRP